MFGITPIIIIISNCRYDAQLVLYPSLPCSSSSSYLSPLNTRMRPFHSFQNPICSKQFPATSPDVEYPLLLLDFAHVLSLTHNYPTFVVHFALQ
jgi:hypothetical protein